MSRSQLVPGKRTTPTIALTIADFASLGSYVDRSYLSASRLPSEVSQSSSSIRASSITGLASNRSHISSVAARAASASGAATSSRMALPTRTPLTPANPSASSARSIVSPAGSAISARGDTSTRTSPLLHDCCASAVWAKRSAPVSERLARQRTRTPRCNGHGLQAMTSSVSGGGGGSLFQPVAAVTSRTGLLVERGAARCPAATDPWAKSARNPA